MSIKEVKGHVAEWFNAPYLKYDVLRYHEFESHLVRSLIRLLSSSISESSAGRREAPEEIEWSR